MTSANTKPVAITIVVSFSLVWLFNIGCGDSLSSLNAIQQSLPKTYGMNLSPDYGRQGEYVTITITGFDLELEELLSSEIVSIPTSISFGENTYLKSFSVNAEDKLEIEIFISPLAPLGQRIPTLGFGLGVKQVKAQGLFWILPALEND